MLVGLCILLDMDTTVLNYVTAHCGMLSSACRTVLDDKLVPACGPQHCLSTLPFQSVHAAHWRTL